LFHNISCILQCIPLFYCSLCDLHENNAKVFIPVYFAVVLNVRVLTHKAQQNYRWFECHIITMMDELTIDFSCMNV
jgi:hypothetical protein